MNADFAVIIQQIDQIQAGLRDQDSEATEKAMKLIQDVADLENGFHMVLEGIKLLLLALDKTEV